MTAAIARAKLRFLDDAALAVVLARARPYVAHNDMDQCIAAHLRALWAVPDEEADGVAAAVMFLAREGHTRG